MSNFLNFRKRIDSITPVRQNKVTQKVRNVVSKKKIRFQEDGFDLDLTYITDRIIAMGFPSTGTEALYRNPLSNVKRFFKRYHRDHFMIYNLCSEKQYDKNLFLDCVMDFPFDDHNPPPLNSMLPWFQHMDEFLKKDSKNVIALHCKAGKGRTGTLISAYLIHTRKIEFPEDALDIFGAIRTLDGKGVTIPSQRRYVHYYWHCISYGFPIKDRIVKLLKITLHTTPKFDNNGGCSPYFKIKCKGNKFNTKKQFGTKFYKNEPIIHFNNLNLILEGDVKFELLDKDTLGKDDKMCHFWINTNFVKTRDPKIFLKKEEIDKACKDKKCKYFDSKFGIVLEFEILFPGIREFKKFKEFVNVGDLRLTK